MSKYYVLIVEESIKAFSMIGHGNEFKFTFAAKGQTTPFEILENGDKIIGYISNDEKRFAYIFSAEKSDSEKECKIIKKFESMSGPTLDDVSDSIKKIIYENENTKSFIQITEKAYAEIVNLMMAICSKEYGLLNDSSGANDAQNDFDDTSRRKTGKNILLYGVPGSGKSWTIEHEYCPKGSVVERLVFHPDYTSSDFIGQILPVVDKENENQVTYEFTPGPFTMILRDAYTHPQQEYILIIEEINRGNAPAIFGDVFQLLDRMVENKTIKGVEYNAGTSEYEITNKNVADIVYRDACHKIRIPSNLSILATMNTSDQNVFTLDTAFQRRWKMRLIENSFDNVRQSLAECPILDTGVSWQRFCEVINKQIVGNKAKMASSEDKRLGVYFVHEKDLEHNNADEPVNHDTLRAELNELLRTEREGSLTDKQKERLEAIRAALMQNRIFPEKVIKYLWDDAFKFNPGAIFDTEENKDLDSLEAVIRLFVYDNRGKDRFRVFNKQIRDLLFEA